MTWSPTPLHHNCFDNAALKSCSPSFLTFLTFISQYMSISNDKSSNSKVTDTAQEEENQYDFIIVGAGSAGCVVANRLTEIEKWKVLLLEAGDEQPIVAEVPGLSSFLMKSSIDYNYKLQPEPIICKNNPNGVCTYSAGKVMGGGSSINVMFYTRGHKEDYDNWSKLGNAGWSWDEVLPYFKKSEDFQDLEQNTLNPSQYRGTGGPLPVTAYQYTNESRAIINAWKAVGLNEVDYNDGNQVGVSRLQTTTSSGVRGSTNSRFIRPIRNKRTNLNVKTNSRVTKILIDSETNRAVGIEYVFQNSTEVRRAFARKEVIISAGVIQSPKLLMLSGIGPADHLREVGIDVIKDLPVGKNYQDHIGAFPTTFLRKRSPTFSSSNDRVKDLQTWVDSKQGPLGQIGTVHSTAFFQAIKDANNTAPDIQVLYVNFAIDPDFLSVSHYTNTPYYDGFIELVLLLTPKSRGYIKLDKVNPVENQPLIQGNYLTNSRDVQLLVEGIKKSQQIFSTSAFRKLRYGQFSVPVPACLPFRLNDSRYFECLVENTGQINYHGVGTCKMGPQTDSEAVVDPQLRVYGIQGLRVVDGSIMPVIIRGSLNAPIIMIAEKASDMIKKDWS